MSYIVDIIIIAVFALVVFISYKKGFIKSLFELVGTLISFTAARIVSQNFAPKGFEMFIEEPARATLTNSLGTVGTTDYGAQAEQAIASIPDSLNGVMELIGINKQSLLDQVSQSDFAQGTLVDNLMTNVVTPVGTAVIQFVLFVVLAVAFSIGLKIVVGLLNAIIRKIPGLGKLNSSLGILVGVLRGFFAVIILSMVLGLAVSITGNETFIDAVNNSTIVSAAQGLISSISGAVLK